MAFEDGAETFGIGIALIGIAIMLIANMQLIIKLILSATPEDMRNMITFFGFVLTAFGFAIAWIFCD